VKALLAGLLLLASAPVNEPARPLTDRARHPCRVGNAGGVYVQIRETGRGD
jgi:hypothetical protein